MVVNCGCRQKINLRFYDMVFTIWLAKIMWVHFDSVKIGKQTKHKLLFNEINFKIEMRIGVFEPHPHYYR